mgnify:CR=1 FL=1
MKSFKVITVCGAGVGTSTLLRMNIDKTFKKFALPLEVTVENKGLSMSKGLMCDAVFTFESFADELRSCYEDVIVINNLMDMNELEEKIKKLLENLTQDLSPHTLEYKTMLSRNKLDTMEYKYLQLFKEINYKIHQVKIDNFADYEKFKTICNLAFDESITEDTFKNNIGILTVSLVPKIDVKVNIGNIKYTYDKLENVNYGYNAHLLIVDKIVNTDCIYNTDLTEISSKVEYDNMKVSYDEEVDNLDKNIFMIDFNSFLNEYKSTNTTISKDEATRNCRKRF